MDKLESRRSREALCKAQQWLAFDTSELAGDQRDLIAKALRNITHGNNPTSVAAAVEMARDVTKRGGR